MADFPVSNPAAGDVRRGIFFVLISVFVFSVSNALLKWQVEFYPVIEVIFFRAFFAWLPCGVLIARSGGISSLRTRRLGGHLSRAAIQFASMLCLITSIRLLPLADAMTISFSSPLFLTMLSMPLLGERVGVHRWGAVLVGFTGVLIMMQPGRGVFESGALFALGNAFFSALATISLRQMSLTESSVTQLFYQLMVTGLVSALLLPWVWVTPSGFDALVLIVVGISTGIAQYWWMLGFRFAPVAVAGPFTYTALIWASMIGFAFWGDVPTPALLCGAFIVVTSGIYIVYRETLSRSHERSEVEKN